MIPERIGVLSAVFYRNYSERLGKYRRVNPLQLFRTSMNRVNMVYNII
jgi:hypothetical protein